MKRHNYLDTVVWQGSLYEVLSSALYRKKIVYELKHHYTREVVSAVPSGELKTLQVQPNGYIETDVGTIDYADPLNVIRLTMTRSEFHKEWDNIGAFCVWQGNRVYLKSNEYRIIRSDAKAGAA
ncbi:MAG: hypothetical protein ACPG7F_11060 [Aggregatilineales bacterium]